MTDADLVRVSRALGDATRLAILRAIADGCGTVCCGDLTRAVRVRPATVSHHLRVLAHAGLVTTRRDGQFIHVRIRPETFAAARRALACFSSAPSGAAAAGRRPRRRRAA
jgi:ArsR family transcriptional regulator